MIGDGAEPVVSRCILVLHDYFFFTSYGFKDTTMNEYIGNYSIMYAINRHNAEVHRNAASTIPRYDFDVRKFTIYATPAQPLRGFTWLGLGRRKISWNWREQVGITFNSIYTIWNSPQPPANEKINLPAMGKKYRIPPLNAFQFFSIGGNPEGLVRIGKKFASARIYSHRLRVEKKDHGFVRPDHPVNPRDLDEYFQIKQAGVITQFPPLLVDCEIGPVDFLVCKESGKTYSIILPSRETYSSVTFP